MFMAQHFLSLFAIRILARNYMSFRAWYLQSVKLNKNIFSDWKLKVINHKQTPKLVSMDKEPLNSEFKISEILKTRIFK